MRFPKLSVIILGAIFVTLCARPALPSPAHAASVSSGSVSVLTQHNNTDRTGVNPNETILNTSNVNTNSFGLLFKLYVDGQIYAQPLYVPNLTIAGGVHNVVFVATMHNYVYAFDADTPGPPLWRTNQLGTPIPLANNQQGIPANQQIGWACGSGTYTDIVDAVGIVSTPVIDPASNTMYLIATNKDGDNSFHHRLHALDLATGQDKLAPQDIQAAYPGIGADSVNGQVPFDNQTQLQRAALLLSHGTIYAAFAGYCDTPPYHELTDWFMPYNVQTLDNNDLDISSSGAVLIPNSNYFFGGGKEGKLYLLNRGALGHFTADSTAQAQAVQSFQVTRNDDGIVRNIHGGPVFWQGPTSAYAYVWGEQDSFKAFRFDYNTNRFDTTPASQSTMLDPTGCGGVCMPGAALSLSSNGSAPGSGIIWTSLPLTGDAAHYVRPGVLRAFDATDLSHELWDSEQNLADHVDTFAKFSAPTIANGHVYLATFSGYLAVYGLRGSSTPVPASGACPSGWTCADIGSPTIAGGQSLSNGAWTVQGAGGDIWNGADQFHYVWQALNGDGNLSARVTSQTNTDVWAKAGLMLRQSADPGAPFYDVLLTPGNGVNVQYRATAGANAVQVTGTPATPPVYVRVARTGNAFTAYTSADGVT